MAVWKEQAVTVQVPGEEIVLEAVWQAGGQHGAVIAPPHPLYGGSLDNPVVNELAYGLHKADVPSLRFNWRGVGASQGQPSGETAEADADYAAALSHLEDTTSGPVIGCGYSFGAAAALRAALKHQQLQTLILVAPPVMMMEEIPLDSLAVSLHVIAGGDDAFAPSATLSELLAPLANAHLEVLPGVDHFFASGGLAEISSFTSAAVSR